MSQPWRIGDRVSRRIDVYDESSRLLTGTVVDAYSDHDSRFGSYPELYEVEWDGGRRERGFLRHGLAPLSVLPKDTREE